MILRCEYSPGNSRLHSGEFARTGQRANNAGKPPGTEGEGTRPLNDDQFGVLTANAKQAGITPNRVEQIAVDPAKPDQMWIIGSAPGFRAKADVSQTPPLEETSRGLAAQAATQDRIQAEPRVAMRR